MVVAVVPEEVDEVLETPEPQPELKMVAAASATIANG